MLHLLFVVNLFVNPEVPHTETLQKVIYAAPLEQDPAEIERRCTRTEQNACYAACARSALSASCVVKTSGDTGVLTRFCYCYDINLQVKAIDSPVSTCENKL